MVLEKLVRVLRDLPVRWREMIRAPISWDSNPVDNVHVGAAMLGELRAEPEMYIRKLEMEEILES